MATNQRAVNAAAAQVGMAGGQIDNAARAAAAGQMGVANRSANAAVTNLANANARLLAEANKARQIGNKNMANNLKKAATAARRAEIIESLKHIARALNLAKNNRSSN